MSAAFGQWRQRCMLRLLTDPALNKEARRNFLFCAGSVAGSEWHHGGHGAKWPLIARRCGLTKLRALSVVDSSIRRRSAKALRLYRRSEGCRA
jgi:hypothetical protein